MTSKQITAVALKCLAIYLLFTVVVTFPMWIYYVRAVASTEGLSPLALAGLTTATVIVGSAIAVVFAFLAWRLANRLALLVATPPVDDIHVSITPRRLEEILFRVLGVYLAVTYLKTVVVEVIRSQLYAAGGYNTTKIGWDLLASLVILIFGLLLTFRPGAVIGLLDRMTKKSQAPTNESRATSDSALSEESEAPQS